MVMNWRVGRAGQWRRQKGGRGRGLVLRWSAPTLLERKNAPGRLGQLTATPIKTDSPPVPLGYRHLVE